jgi:transcriptional regulator with XRE-family HTH domain
MTAGEWIREEREAQGLSQDELAFRSRVPSRQIGAYERGENEPGAVNLSKIADALGKPLPWSTRISDGDTARLLSEPDWGRGLEPDDLVASMG